MAYIAPIHRPSSVRHAIKLKFFSEDEDCLVVAKSNRLEFYTQSADEDGLLQLRHSELVYGKITMLQKIKPDKSETEHLFVGTHRYMYFTLAWNPELRQAETPTESITLGDRTAREVQTEQRCLIDPKNEYMTLEVYEGIITAIPLTRRGKKKEILESGVLGEPAAARIPEFVVRSSAFLTRPPDKGKNEKPKHVVLYTQFEDQVRLKIRELSYTMLGGGDAAVEFEDDSKISIVKEVKDIGANTLIPIEGAPYGLLILGETQISYLADEKSEIMSRPLKEGATSFKTWARIDQQRYVLGDLYGKLYLLMLMLDFADKVQDWRLDLLGEIPVASSLVYLDAGYLYVGSHQGDSRLVKIVEAKGGGALETVQTFSNVAPILDFTIMDMGNRSGEGSTNEYSSGQARLVTGSGAFSDGSLRSVRSGVAMQELGIMGEMDNATDIFGLQSAHGADYDDLLLVSFINETRLFKFGPDGDVEEVDSHSSLILDDSTLLAKSLAGGQLLQVTPMRVQIVDLNSGMSTASWSCAPGKLTSVAASDSKVLLSVDGRTLSVLDIDSDLRVSASKQFADAQQISCLTLSNELPNTCIVGHWQRSAISLLALSDLSTQRTVQISEDSVAIPRSLMIARIFEPPQPPTLLVAAADGNVVTFDINASGQLGGKKSTLLGTQEASFKAISRSQGLQSVFATSEHSSLIYSSEGRIVFSAVTAENAVAVCAFDSEAFPGAIAIATSKDLRVAIIDTERTTHVQTLTVGETVRRIAYSPALHAFGLGTIKLILSDGVESLQSHFKITDEVQFKELDSYTLKPDEIVETVVRAELEDGSGDLAERFIVGTSVVDEDDISDHRGRIIVFEVTADRILKQVAEQRVRGACRRLGVMNGKIVAALVKTIVVFEFKYATGSQPVFEKKCTYRTSTAPIDLTITGNKIAVADLMKSVSILQYIPNSNAAGGNDELSEIARHYQTVWTTAVSDLGDNSWLMADSEENLMVLNRDVEGVTEDDRRRLKVTSEINLGEMVNRIRAVDVFVKEGALVLPKAFLGTVDGSIYLFALITPNYQNILIELQNNLSNLINSPGNLPFNVFRAYKNEVREMDEPQRFVDGELVDRFLDCTAEEQESAVTGLGVGVEEVRDLVEGLRRLR